MISAAAGAGGQVCDHGPDTRPRAPYTATVREHQRPDMGDKKKSDWHTPKKKSDPGPRSTGQGSSSVSTVSISFWISVGVVQTPPFVYTRPLPATTRLTPSADSCPTPSPPQCLPPCRPSRPPPACLFRTTRSSVRGRRPHTTLEQRHDVLRYAGVEWR